MQNWIISFNLPLWKMAIMLRTFVLDDIRNLIVSEFTCTQQFSSSQRTFTWAIPFLRRCQNRSIQHWERHLIYHGCRSSNASSTPFFLYHADRVKKSTHILSQSAICSCFVKNKGEISEVFRLLLKHRRKNINAFLIDIKNEDGIYHIRSELVAFIYLEAV